MSEHDTPDTEAAPTAAAEPLTTELPADHPAATPEAWSLDDTSEVDSPPPRSRLVWAGLVTLVVLIAGALIFFATTLFASERSNIVTASKTPPPAAVLDGTYRLDYNYAQQTLHGSPDPRPATQPQTETFWAAYRSTCKSTGCVATGTMLDNDNHRVAATPSSTSEFHFAENRWQRVPIRTRVQYQQCSVEEDKRVPGSDTEVFTLSMEPQPDGTLRGLRTNTVLTSECGLQGAVRQTPFVATRVTGLPPGITIADPATVASPPTTSTAAAAEAGHHLDGTYRLDSDGAHHKHNGVIQPETETNSTQWWAFHSACKSTGCVAAGVTLDDANHQEASGGSTVLQFAAGHWQDKPANILIDCGVVASGEPNPADKVSSTQTWSWQPQPDGTLRVVRTTTVPDGCGIPGWEFEDSFVATRVGDVPSNVVLADPALF